MLAYAIEIAKASNLFSHIVLSTDDEEIAAVGREYGAKTPFMRPASLADDHCGTMDVIEHALRECQALGWLTPYSCCLYPCVPFLMPADLQEGFSALEASKANFSFAVTPFPAVIQRGLRRLDDGTMRPFFPEYQMTRTQDLASAYYDVGQFYWGRSDKFLAKSSIHEGGIGHIIPAWRAVDIDTREDWERAELLARALALGKASG